MHHARQTKEATYLDLIAIWAAKGQQILWCNFYQVFSLMNNLKQGTRNSSKSKLQSKQANWEPTLKELIKSSQLGSHAAMTPVKSRKTKADEKGVHNSTTKGDRTTTTVKRKPSDIKISVNNPKSIQKKANSTHRKQLSSTKDTCFQSLHSIGSLHQTVQLVRDRGYCETGTRKGKDAQGSGYGASAQGKGKGEKDCQMVVKLGKKKQEYVCEGLEPRITSKKTFKASITPFTPTGTPLLVSKEQRGDLTERGVGSSHCCFMQSCAEQLERVQKNYQTVVREQKQSIDSLVQQLQKQKSSGNCLALQVSERESALLLLQRQIEMKKKQLQIQKQEKGLIEREKENLGMQVRLFQQRASSLSLRVEELVDQKAILTDRLNKNEQQKQKIKANAQKVIAVVRQQICGLKSSHSSTEEVCSP